MSRNVVVPTGSANLASVLAAFRRLGIELAEARSAIDIEAADRVVLPGVGTFGAAMAKLTSLGVVEAIRSRVDEDRPTLAVCVGMQVLGIASDESPEVSGIGAVGDGVGRFATGLIVPQLAWAQVKPDPGSRYFEPGWAYFANSYRFEEMPEGWSGATAIYGEPYVAAMEKGNVLACQFHPELSGAWGTTLLARWLSLTAGAR